MEARSQLTRCFFGYTAAVMLGIAYGHSIKALSDDYIQRTEEAIRLAIQGGGPASTLVDFFPICECRSHLLSPGNLPE